MKGSPFAAFSFLASSLPVYYDQGASGKVDATSDQPSIMPQIATQIMPRATMIGYAPGISHYTMARNIKNTALPKSLSRKLKYVLTTRLGFISLLISIQSRPRIKAM